MAPPPYYYPPPDPYMQAFGAERCMPYRIDDYSDGDPVPFGYVARTAPMSKLAIAGGSTLGGLWVITMALGALSLEESGDDRAGEKHAPLFVPVVGPFIGAATLDPESFIGSLLILDGLGQMAGLTMFIVGLSVDQTYLVRTGDLELDVAPIVTAGAQGVGLTGRF